MAANRDRLAAVLAYQAEKRRRLAEYVPTIDQTEPVRPSSAGFGTNLENLSSGIGQGIVNQLEGVKSLVTDPVGTAKAAYEGVKGVVRNPAVLAEALRQTGQKAISGPLGAGEVLGEFLTPSVKGVGKRDIFIGENAKTWNNKEADRALAMEAYGVDPEAIWRETGTFRGVDGKWRQEISDSKAKGIYTHIAPSEQRLSEMAIEHPELLEAYPDIAKIQQFGLQGPKERGSYQATTMETVDGPRLLGEMVMAEAPTEDVLARTAIHEMQHAIQRREGFQRGANPAEFKNKAIPAKLKDVAFSRSMREMAIANKMREMGYPIAEGKVLNLARPNTMEKVKAYADNDEQLKNLVNEWEIANEKLKKYPDKATQYVRSAGEVEARAVQARQKMTPEERRATFPLKSYDTPIKDIIIRKK
jgi:hypothetical protein